VEYARNVLTTLWGVNESGQGLFEGKVKRSFDRSPEFWGSTFSSMQTVAYNGQITGAYVMDIPRLDNVFKACARAIHFRETGAKQSDWGLVKPRLIFDENVHDTDKRGWLDLCRFLQELGFEQKATANPLVFQYGTAEIEGSPVYCFVFYGSFIVYALPIPERVKQNLIVPRIQLGLKG
jgi:hypothetical protein